MYFEFWIARRGAGRTGAPSKAVFVNFNEREGENLEVGKSPGGEDEEPSENSDEEKGKDGRKFCPSERNVSPRCLGDGVVRDGARSMCYYICRGERWSRVLITLAN